MTGNAANNLTPDPSGATPPEGGDGTPPHGDTPPEGGTPPDPQGAQPPEGGGEPSGGEGGEPSGDEGDPAGSGDENRAKKRIRSLVAENRALRDYGEFWRGKATGAAGEGKSKDDTPAADKPAPKLADFGGDSDRWAEAYAQWNDERVEQRVSKAVESGLSKVKEADGETQIREQWKGRLEKFTEAHDDAIEVIGDPSFTQSAVMSRVIMASEHGPAIAYHLSQNRAENERIKQLPPELQAAELGRLEAKLAGTQAPTPDGAGGDGDAPDAKNKGKPPPHPPKTLSGGGGAQGVDLERCSLDQFLDHHYKTTQKRRH